MVRKVRIFEYTTFDYGKGYVIAKNQRSADKKTMGFNLGKVYGKNSSNPELLRVSYYDKLTKEEAKKKYNARLRLF